MGEAAPADNGDVVVDVAPGLVAVQPPAEGLGAPSSFDWGDEMEESDRKDEERMVEIEAKIAAENEKARARAERFGVDFVEPKLEVILTREEIDIFRAVTKARQPLPDEDPQAAQQGRGERRRKGRRTDMDIMASDEIQGQVRDREYTEALLAKVAELHKAAKARAEKFGEEYVPPRLKVLLTPTEYRKYMSATAGRNPLDMEFAPVAGLDTTTEEERELQRKRASRFSAEGAEGAGEGGAEGAAGADDAMDADEEGKERARAAKFGLEVSAAPYGENVRKRFICERRDMEENAELVHDSVHCFGLDRLSTAEIMRYFEDFAPSFVLWLNDSSANVVFGDPANARRAYITIGEPILLAAGATTAETTAPEDEEMGDADEAAPAPAPAPGAEVREDPWWRRGPDYRKSGKRYPVLLRPASTLDKKPEKLQKSRRLWLQGNKPQRRAAGGYGDGYGGGYGGGYCGGEAAAAPAEEAPAEPLVDLRESLGKIRARKKGRAARASPYGRGGRGRGGDDGGEGDEAPAMMDENEAEAIMAQPAPAAAPPALTAAEEAAVAQATADAQMQD